MKKAVIYILLISWMTLIFFFSNQPALESDITSNSVIGKIITVVEWVSNYKFSAEELDVFYKYAVFPVRKLAHLTLYFVLGILFYNLVKLYYLEHKTLFLISILACILYACSDEIHQLFVLGRTGSIKDVLIDTLGSLMGILLVIKLMKKKNFKKQN